MKYSELNLGQIEALGNKLGGMKGIEDILAGKLVVVPRGTQLHFHTDLNLDIWTKVYDGIRFRDHLFRTELPLVFKNSQSYWSVPVLSGLNFMMLVDAYRSLGIPVSDTYEGQIDRAVIQNDRDPSKGSYLAVFDRDSEPAVSNTSALQARLGKICGSTLMESMLLGLGYCIATSCNTDVRMHSVCSGSRDLKGDVPRIHFNGPDLVIGRQPESLCEKHWAIRQLAFPPAN